MVKQKGRLKGAKDLKPRSRRSKFAMQCDAEGFDFASMGKAYYKLRNDGMRTMNGALDILGYDDVAIWNIRKRSKEGHEHEQMFMAEIREQNIKLRDKNVKLFTVAAKDNPKYLENALDKYHPDLQRNVNKMAVDIKALQEIRLMIPEIVGMFGGALLGKKVPPKYRAICEETFVELFNSAIEDREMKLGLGE